MKGSNLGEFEELVLLAACVRHEEAYTVSIQDELAQQAGRSVSISTVHAALTRLQDKGYLRSQMGGATDERGGRRKRLFTVTPAGLEALRESQAARANLRSRLPRPVLDVLLP